MSWPVHFYSEGKVINIEHHTTYTQLGSEGCARVIPLAVIKTEIPDPGNPNGDIFKLSNMFVAAKVGARVYVSRILLDVFFRTIQSGEEHIKPQVIYSRED